MTKERSIRAAKQAVRELVARDAQAAAVSIGVFVGQKLGEKTYTAEQVATFLLENAKVLGVDLLTTIVPDEEDIHALVVDFDSIPFLTE